MLKKAVQQGRSERRGEGRTLRYVEPLSEARTMLANFFSILLDEGCSMETAKRDELLGTLTWWGFHALLLWLGAEHFLFGPPSDGHISTLDLFAGSLMGATLLSLLRLSVGRHLLRFIALIGICHELYQVWQGKAEWGSLTYVAIWAYTFYSFGPSSWRNALYTPLGVFGKMKT